jgi:predicted DNA-binding transcriptional regulator AlpA
MTARKADIADLPSWPRLLSREQAAAYCGLSANSFMAEVEAGTFPGPVALSTTRRRLWDRLGLDRALDSRLTGAPEDRNARKAQWQQRQDRKADSR